MTVFVTVQWRCVHEPRLLGNVGETMRIKYGQSGGRRHLRGHSQLFLRKRQTQQTRPGPTGVPRGADNGTSRRWLGVGGCGRSVFLVPHRGRYVLLLRRVSGEDVPRFELFQEQGVTGHGHNHWRFLFKR